MFSASPFEKAYLAPFAGFLVLLGMGEIVAKVGDGSAHWALAFPQYWVYPLQTVVCAALLARYWRQYEWHPRRMLSALLIGVLVLAAWIAPQELFGAPRRQEGFEPAFFGAGWPHLINLSVRFIRLVIVVPLVEEIFWRGFLLRFIINDDISKVSFGTFSWRSFTVVTIGFCVEHHPEDYPAAIIAGGLYNLVAYRTRSLAACVVAHAITNLGLGFYVLATRQWGFW